LPSFTDPDSVVIAGAAAVLVLALAISAWIGLLLGRRRGRAGGTEQRELDEQGEEEARELRKSVWLLQNESKNLSTFLNLLPEFARALNTSLEKRRVAPLLRQMIEQILDPQQILIFYTSHNNDGLILVEHKGLDSRCDASRIIPFGEGRVGWVASHQISMDENDFQQKGRLLKEDFGGASDPAFRVELAVPMAHKEQLFGLISVGGMLRHPKNEKTMLRMVADLGSVALNNSFLFNRMEQLVNSDGLTQLCTKRFFLTRLAEELIRAEQRHQELSLFIFDIDHFKHYNDNNGHLAGDECLRLTGRLLRETVREDDVPARYGGEEFVVLLPNTPKQGAFVIAEKIRSAIQSYQYPKETNQPGGDLTISGGVASFPYDGRTTAELISAADEALYQAKRSGRNRVVVHEPTYLSEPEDCLTPVVGAGSEE
jgi:diguanylate cyclase (GGDEF)-like protein